MTAAAPAEPPPAAAPDPPRRRRTVRPPRVALVSWRAGVHVVGTRLWCDALRAHDLCFVSGVQALRRGGRTAVGTLLCTERTLRLRQALGERAPASQLLSPVGRPFQLGTLRLELFPSGEGPGAASLWLKLPSGQCVIYAGAPCALPAAGVEPMQVRAGEALVCAAPLAAYDGELPSRDTALQALRELVGQAQADDAATVILCAPQAGAPTIWSQLVTDGAGVVVHAEIARVLAAHQQLGLLPPTGDAPQALRRFSRPLGPGAVVLWPAAVPLPATARLQGPAARDLRVVLCLGAALSEGVVARVRAALPDGAKLAGAIALADGLDQAALRRYISDSEARTVYLTAGYNEALAASLRQSGVRLEPLGPPRQLPLFG